MCKEIADLRKLIEKRNGKVASENSIAYMFESKGTVVVKHSQEEADENAKVDPEEIAIEVGAEVNPVNYDPPHYPTGNYLTEESQIWCHTNMSRILAGSRCIHLCHCAPTTQCLLGAAPYLSQMLKAAERAQFVHDVFR